MFDVAEIILKLFQVFHFTCDRRQWLHVTQNNEIIIIIILFHT